MKDFYESLKIFDVDNLNKEKFFFVIVFLRVNNFLINYVGLVVDDFFIFKIKIFLINEYYDGKE